MGMQQAVAGAPTATPGQPGTQKSEIQQAGAAQATQAGEIVNKAAAATQKQTAQVGALGVEEAGRAGVEATGQASVDATQSATADGASLASFGRDVKEQLFDMRISFERDESGRKLLNESQLIDHTVASAKSENEFKQRMQTASLTHEKKMKLLQIAQQKIVEAMKHASQSKIQDRDQATKEQLAIAKANLDREIAAAQAEAANNQAMWQAGGTIVGAGIGAATPLGPAGGAMIGGAVGSAAGAQANR